MNDHERNMLHRSFIIKKRKISQDKRLNDKKKKDEDNDTDLTTYYLRISAINGKASNASLPSINFITRGKALSRTFSLMTKQAKSFFSLPQTLDSTLKYVIFYGNNSEVIKNSIKKRASWEEIPSIEHANAHFIWQPLSKNLRFDRLLPYLPKQAANHFENHFELTDKKNLYRNLSQYCSESSLNINDLVPKTFFIELRKPEGKSQMKHFVCYFKIYCKGKRTLWIFKPSGLNRGQGIRVFSKLSVFKEVIKEVMKAKECDSVVVQKYIENPLLYNKRKFDVRMWVLVNHEYKCYFCKEGYIRTSSEEFNLDCSDVGNRFVHLTNNAVQAKGPKYGLWEDGNQVGLRELEKILPDGVSVEEVVARMKELVGVSLQAVKKKINPMKRQFCFELFGYDFLIDCFGKVWLIECNTNPCLELSSKLLERLIPQMIDQVLGLTIDKIFNKDSPENTLWEYILSI